MASLVFLIIPFLLQVWTSNAEIDGKPVKNELVKKTPDPAVAQPKHAPVKKFSLKDINPVGAPVGKIFMPLTEIPPPAAPGVHLHGGRRHMDPNCDKIPTPSIVHEGPRVEIFGDYYEERFAKTVATVIFPDHIDHKHFEVTTQVPYLTVGPIDGIGYHPSTLQPPNECEKIYMDHIAELYSDEEAKGTSEESLEMARMPLFHPEGVNAPIDTEAEVDMYGN